MDTPTLFDEEIRQEKINGLKNPLFELDSIIDWNIFRKPISDALVKSVKGPGGRPAFDYVIMFKILVLQKLYNISDEQTEFQILDRQSFRTFLKIANKVPDSTTIWLFRENLTNAGVIDKLFALFNKQLESKNLITKTGCIVDASFVEVPRQRNTRDENKEIKNGKIPENWDNPKKISQKDTDARWTMKRNIAHYGYKNHIKIDKDSKIITRFSITAANVHDSIEIDKLIDENDKELYADAGYIGTENKLPENVLKHICAKGYRYKKLTDNDKEQNRIKSKIRCRVEHVFGTMKTAMNNALKIRSIGIKRAVFLVGLANLVYNILRLKTIIKYRQTVSF